MLNWHFYRVLCILSTLFYAQFLSATFIHIYILRTMKGEDDLVTSLSYNASCQLISSLSVCCPFPQRSRDSRSTELYHSLEA